jgi:hypothetical protein
MSFNIVKNESDSESSEDETIVRCALCDLRKRMVELVALMDSRMGRNRKKTWKLTFGTRWPHVCFGKLGTGMVPVSLSYTTIVLGLTTRAVPFKSKVNLHTDEEWEKRRKAWVPPPLRVSQGTPLNSFHDGWFPLLGREGLLSNSLVQF